MKSNTTFIWFVLAVLLGGTAWLVERHTQPPPPSDTTLLAGLHASEVTAIDISPAGMREISVLRTNKSWVLERPVAYPAQAATIEILLTALEKLSPTLRLTAAEMASKNADTEFGFDNPQFRLDVTAGERSWHLNIGNKTAPGDGVYVRLVGGAGTFVTEVNWLQALPHDANAWRDTSLVADVSTIDWLIITNGAKAIELRRDATNRQWRMVRPLQTRADSVRITSALQQLHATKVTRFVTDDTKADLTTYGLAPVDLDVWMGHGTNSVGAIHAGKESTENPGQLFARREGWNSVVTLAKEALTPWRGDVNDFRDPHLLSFTAPIAEIEVTGENNFTLHQQSSNQWSVANEKFPVDMENLQMFVRLLANLHMTEFVKDVVTSADLQGFGLAPTNSRTITFRSVPGDTNTVITRLLFGATETNRVFVKRGDEDFVYAVDLAAMNQLPENGWELRDRRIWNFAVTNVAQITLRQNGRMLQVNRNGANQWSIAPGSQGRVDPVGLEESAKQFGTLTAAGWIGRNFPAPEKFGMNTNNLQINFELKTGEKMAVDFGTEIPSQNAPTALAAVTLDGDRWAFVFPPTVFQLVAAYLTVPPAP